jgi:hypothetical protein
MMEIDPRWDHKQNFDFMYGVQLQAMGRLHLVMELFSIDLATPVSASSILVECFRILVDEQHTNGMYNGSSIKI